MKDNKIPSPLVSLLPVFVLILLLFVTIRTFGSDALSGGSQVCLLVATAVCVLIGMAGFRRPWKDFELAVTNNIAGVSTALIILLIIGALSGAWMVSGVARSNVDLVDTQAEQGMKDFELNVCKMVRQFNLQAYRVAVAAKTDKTADRRHDVARRLYILGKSTILDLNAAITEKDTARRNYITALKTYWSLYYGIRSMTGYDFLRKAEISCTIPKP